MAKNKSRSMTLPTIVHVFFSSFLLDIGEIKIDDKKLLSFRLFGATWIKTIGIRFSFYRVRLYLVTNRL